MYGLYCEGVCTFRELCVLQVNYLSNWYHSIQVIINRHVFCHHKGTVMPEASQSTPDTPIGIKTIRKNKRKFAFRWFLISLARGLAFFLAVYIILSLLNAVFGGGYNANIWWIDLKRFPLALSGLLHLLVAAVLISFTLKIPQQMKWRIIGTATCFFFAHFAFTNALIVAELGRKGTIALGFPIPFSLFVTFAFCILGITIFFSYGALKKTETKASVVQAAEDAKEEKAKTQRLFPASPIKTFLTAALMVAVCGVLFPLGQVFCFGMTDYRTHADAAIVLGAKVLPNGTLSNALAGRVDTAIDLYDQGYVSALIMSGGTGVEGVNEAEAMKRYAVDRGIPAKDIFLDRNGNSTELTVKNTIEIAEKQGFQTVIAVSSFYHMPRIKMLYLTEDHNVLTVPSDGAKEGASAYVAALREIPGWWYYWFKNIFL